MRNYPCRLHPAPVLCILLPALRFKLSASCFMHSASSSPLMHQTLRFQLPALRSLLPTSCLLRSLLSPLCSLRPLLSAICFLLPASCALCLYPLLFTLYSLLLRSQLSALSSLLSAPCLLIGTLRKMVFREVVSMGSEPQLFHTPKKRVRSATSRRTPTLSVCYQLAFFTPGIRPFEAISRNWIRLMPN